MDSDAGKPDDARTYWQGVFRAAGRPAVRVVILTDPGWTVPGLRTAGYVRQLAGILHAAPARGTTGVSPVGFLPARGTTGVPPVALWDGLQLDRRDACRTNLPEGST
jgi:hypothetical protein